jgi:hypothetical protein
MSGNTNCVQFCTIEPRSAGLNGAELNAIGINYGMLLLYPLQSNAPSGVGLFSQLTIVRRIVFDSSRSRGF